MSGSASEAGRLHRADPRPLLVTLVVVGWLVLSGFGAVRALVVLGNAASTRYLGVEDPRARIAQEMPELVTPEQEGHWAVRRQLQRLEVGLAGPLLGVAIVGIVGAVRLFRRKPYSRALLLGVGLVAIGISGYHLYESLRITTLVPVAESGLQDAREMLPAFFAVAGINLAVQSLPLVLVMSLLRHPLVRDHATGSPGTSRELETR